MKKVRYFVNFEDKSSGSEEILEIGSELQIGDIVDCRDEGIDKKEWEGAVTYRWFDVRENKFIFNVVCK